MYLFNCDCSFGVDFGMKNLGIGFNGLENV